MANSVMPFGFLLIDDHGKPSGGLRLAFDQSDIPNASQTVVTMANIQPGFTDGMENVDLYRLEITKAGLYLVRGVVTWNVTTIDKLHNGSIYRNSNTLLSSDKCYPAALGNATNTPIWIGPLAVGDYLRLKVYHNEGVATPDIYGNVSIDYTALNAHFIRKT